MAYRFGPNKWIWQKRFFLLGGGVLMILSACSLLPVRFVNIAIDEDHQLAIPNYLDQMPELNDSATLSYGNPYKEVFFVGHFQNWDSLQVHHPDKGLEDFYDFHIEKLLPALQEPIAPPPDSTVIGGFPALDGDLEGIYKGDKISYRLVIIQASKGLFQALIWTPAGNREEFQSDVNRMISSFQELNVQAEISDSQTDTELHMSK